MTEDSFKTFLSEHINTDRHEIDLRWSLFIAASSSYRQETTLHPYPPMAMYTSSDKLDKYFTKIVDVSRSVPKITDINADELNNWSVESLELFKWVMDKHSFELKLRPRSILEELKGLARQESSTSYPDYIFEVMYNETAENKFKHKSVSRNILYGFHGSKLENFYSILHHGFYSHLNKNSLFGEGTYLAKELPVSLHYSPYGLSWDLSILGKRISCVAFCEIIDDDSVKYYTDNSSTNKSMIKDSIGGVIPQKYIIVRNNDMLRVKFLLIYSSSNNIVRTNSPILTFIMRNKYVLFLGIYLLILVCISLSNGKLLHNFTKNFY